MDIIGGVQNRSNKHLEAVGKKRRRTLIVAHHKVAMRVAAVRGMSNGVPQNGVARSTQECG